MVEKANPPMDCFCGENWMDNEKLTYAALKGAFVFLNFKIIKSGNLKNFIDYDAQFLIKNSILKKDK